MEMEQIPFPGGGPHCLVGVLDNGRDVVAKNLRRVIFLQ
jgi:hypothetical protein